MTIQWRGHPALFRWLSMTTLVLALSGCDIPGIFSEICGRDPIAVTSFEEPEELDEVCEVGSEDCTLRAAINTANICLGQSVIALEPGTYSLSDVAVTRVVEGEGGLVTQPVTSLPIIRKPLTIEGRGATIQNTTVQARALQAEGGAFVWLKDLTIRGGRALPPNWSESRVPTIAQSEDPEYEGGIIRTDGGIRLDNVVLEGGWAVKGGAIYSDRGADIRNDSRIVRNRASLGGGVYSAEFGVAVWDSHFENNVGTAARGLENAADIFSPGGVELRNSGFVGAKGSSSILAFRGFRMFNSSIVSDDLTWSALQIEFVDENISHSTIALTGSGPNQPAIWECFNTGDNSMIVSSSTFSAPLLSRDSDGIGCTFSFLRSALSISPGALEPCSSPDNIFERTDRFNVSTVSGCGVSRISPDLRLAPPALNGGTTLSMLPLPNSPLVDRIPCPETTRRDQRGDVTVNGDGCDIGAIER